MPANAGTHARKDRPVGGWILAFARMTVRVWLFEFKVVELVPQGRGQRNIVGF